MMRYFPFIIISLILYSLFFYHSQKPELLSLVDHQANQEKIIKSKVVAFDFEKVNDVASTTVSNTVNNDPLENQAMQKSSQEIQLQIPEDTSLSLESESVEKTSLLKPELIVDGVKSTPETSKVIAHIETPIQETLKTIPESTIPTVKVVKNIKPLSTKVVPEYDIPTPVNDNPVTLNPVNLNEATVTVSDSKTEAIEAQREQLSPASRFSLQATEAALLKGEFYDDNFHLHLPPAPVKSIKTPIKSASDKSSTVESAISTQASASESLLKLTQSRPKTDKNNQEVKENNDKPKRVFKKSLKPQVNNSNNLIPQAIVASGNTPNYPIQAVNEKLEGSVTVKFIVSMQGNSKNIQVVNSSGHKILDKTVLDFVKKERFMPSFDGIEKVTSEQQFSFKFTAE